MPLKILISGAGICGPALSIILLHSNPAHNITVVEQSPDIRTAGAQIDLRGQGITIIKKLGLMKKVEERIVKEAGLAFVDSESRTKAFFGVNDSGKGQQALTSEYEIMRGDLVNLLYEESIEVAKAGEKAGGGGGLRYKFGTSATELKQDNDGVDVVFSDGSSDRYDLVVGCDGQGSRTRRMAWGDELGDDVFKSLGTSIAFFSIPRKEGGEGREDVGKIFQMPGQRIICTRTNNRPFTQVIVGTMNVTEELGASAKKSVDEQKAAWKKLYDDCTWQHDRLLKGLEDCDDFYMANVVQLKMDRWSKGRVVLVGDAGYCPSPLTGQGSTGALIGSYILAGELTKNGDNIAAALESYNKIMRPYVDEMQKRVPGAAMMYCKTKWGIQAMQIFLKVFTMLKIDRAMNKLLPEDKGGIPLPEYPGLNLPEDAAK